MGKKTLTKKYQKTKANVATLAKKVDNIAKKQKQGYQWIAMGNRYYDDLVARPFAQYNLINYLNCKLIFGTGANDVQSNNSWYHSSTDIDLCLELGNEEDNVTFSLYIVKLKDECSKKLNTTTGVLTLTTDIDYSSNDIVADGYQVFLNPALFDVKWSKRITIGNNSAQPVVASGIGYKNESLCTYYRTHIKLPIGKYMTNPNGDVQQLACLPDVGKNYYLLAFNDNQGGDTEYPIIKLNMVHHIKVPT